jgi:hypothetical protein
MMNLAFSILLTQTRQMHSCPDNVAKAGGSQSQDAKGEAVALYCDPLATPDLASSGFPGRVKK